MTDETLQDADPRPGSNLKGLASGAAWTYLLDSLDVDRVLCIGRPSDAALTTLERIGRHVQILGDRFEPGVGFPGIPDGTIDLAYVTKAGRQMSDLRLLVPVVVRALASGGRLYVEGRRSEPIAEVLRDAGLDEAAAFWLTPSRGEMRSALPLEDEQMRSYFVARGITVPSLRRPWRYAERWLAVTASGNRVGWLARRTDADGKGRRRVPEYIRAMAAAEGVDLSRLRFGLSARGRYSSRKVIFYLFGEGKEPTFVVKATRDPSHNQRLANEEVALRHIAKRRLVAEGTAPRVIFAGEHGGLKILGETAIDGVLLSSGAHRSGSAAAFEWLTELGAVSARRDVAGREAIESTISATESAINRIYRLERLERERLRGAASALIEQAGSLPTVFAHGDAGTWNVILRPNGSVAFLDWEAAKADGMPMWDLFSFARSHVLDRAAVRRVARRPPSLIRSLYDDKVVGEAIEHYRRRLDIPRDLVAPLFTMCWGHRAVREVTRLGEADVSRGHYVGLLRACLQSQRLTWPLADPRRVTAL